MSVYLMAQIHIHDRERYARYEAGFIEVLNDHDGTLVVVDDAATVIEGDWPFNRSVLVRFETEVAALGWYNSDAYQRLLEHRLAASVGNLSLIHI